MEAYPRKQRLALLVVLLVVTTAWWMAQWWPAASVGTPILTAATTIRTAAKAEESRNSRPAPAAFAFNPNTVTAAELQQLGLSAKQAASWLKFRGERTDAFRSPEDISQLFVLSEDDKARLIPLAYVTAQPRVQGKDKVQGFAFDPNTVSSRDLQRLGLSPKQAAAWLKFRGDRRRAFRTPEDIRKLFVLSDKDKDRLVALATVPASSNASQPAEGVARQRFSFDPNTISTDSLQLLGFPRWQAEAFGRYRGGRATTFRRATDLRRVGALDSALVESVLELVALAPLPDKTPASSPNKGTPTTYAYRPKAPLPAPASIDVNTADTSVWKSLPGIGAYRAKRILRFRRALGGFRSVDQVGDTRGLPDSTFQRIRLYLQFATPPRQLPVNRATYEELNRHPYINRNLANVIVKNREKGGPFRGPEDLRRIRLVTDEVYAKVIPYLSFE